MSHPNGNPSAWRRSNFILLIGFNLLYLAWAAWQITRSSNAEFLLYIGVVSLAIVFVFYLNQCFQLNIYSLWGLSFWGLFHMLGGLMSVPESWPTGAPKKVLYNLWLVQDVLKYDQFVHAFGYGMTTWVVWQAVKGIFRSYNIQPTSIGGWLFICVLASLGLGSINEIVEFFATLFMPETNVGGYYNTGFDLVFNTIGAFVAAAFIYLFEK